jgi:hypothetical protein
VIVVPFLTERDPGINSFLQMIIILESGGSHLLPELFPNPSSFLVQEVKMKIENIAINKMHQIFIEKI